MAAGPVWKSAKEFKNESYHNMKLLLVSALVLLDIGVINSGCRKSVDEMATPEDTSTVIAPAIDPPLAPTIGFFLDDWEPRIFTAPAGFITITPPSSSTVTVTLDRSEIITRIPRSFAGNNANIWMSQMVTEPDLLDHITTLHPHLIRFPGGSLSDKFFWNALPNSPPADAPSQLLLANGNAEAAGYWYGKNSGSWTCSVDNYYNMLQLTGNKGMITVNYGYARYGTGPDPVAAAAHLAADWVRYDNGRTKYWEIGNENYGDWEAGYRINTAANQDGQPEYASGNLYGQHFRLFADSMRKAAMEINTAIYIGAVLYESCNPQPWWTSTTTGWNNGLLAAAGNTPDFYIVHSYYTPYNTNSGAAAILNTPLTVTKDVMTCVKQSVSAAGMAQKPVILSEWNIFATGSKQQVSHVNGLHAVMVLGESLHNEFGMTARWDLANGWSNGDDHGLFNIGDEPDGVPRWNPRPAFYHMYFFHKMLGDRLVSSVSSSADIISYASSFTSGEAGVAMVNISTSAVNVEVKTKNFHKGKNFYWYTLTGGSDNGEFSRKVVVNNYASAFASGGPATYKSINPFGSDASGSIRVSVPARSSVFLVIEKK